MKITVDTNVLVRSVVRDDVEQARIADKELRDATSIVIPLPCLCEFAWVLRRVYKFSYSDIAAAIRILIEIERVATNRPAVEAGLAILDAGGDFADGVIAYDGSRSGGATFVSFDKKAVSLLTKQGRSARLL